MAISVKRYDPFTTILPVILQTHYILATVFNSSFTILSIGRGLFMCPLSHATLTKYQKRGRFYNGRGLL